MSAITKDDLWKLFSLMMSALVLPLAAWVWSTNIKVAELQNDLGDVESAVVELEGKILDSEENARQIISIDKDIEYMKGSLGRIEQLVTSK
tara:strand:+ start:1644 stop:1916 length:273 start_codon:yes stop_codon:yes gene_type:complete